MIRSHHRHLGLSLNHCRLSVAVGLFKGCYHTVNTVESTEFILAAAHWMDS